MMMTMMMVTMGLRRQTVLTFLLWLILRPSVIYHYKNNIKMIL